MTANISVKVHRHFEANCLRFLALPNPSDQFRYFIWSMNTIYIYEQRVWGRLISNVDRPTGRSEILDFRLTSIRFERDGQVRTRLMFQPSGLSASIKEKSNNHSH